ncbi:MAG: tetratricopeptide repeat protein [Deltaproteobacteria bacterium]|nr:tetratricopeptide repeat protein [Deltaproteobacteria bacterium]
MKNVINFLVIITLIFPIGTLNQEKLYGEEKSTAKTEKKYEKKGFLDRLWIKIRKLSPNKYNKRSNTAVAGIKGAEKGSEELKPIWKGHESDKLLAESAALKSAEDFMNSDNFPEALVALNSFREDYPESQFMPNVLFMSAICYLKVKEPQKAETDLQTLISKYSGHELKTEARELMRTLEKK